MSISSLAEKHFRDLIAQFTKAQNDEDKRRFMQLISLEFSPWEMAHYLLLAEDKESASLFRAFLSRENPGIAFRVETLLNASRWRDPFNEGIARDFGSQ